MRFRHAIYILGLSLCVVALVRLMDLRGAHFDDSHYSTPLGRVLKAQNDTRIKKKQSLIFQPLQQALPLFKNDIVYSGENSMVLVKLDAGTEIELLSNSLIEITEVKEEKYDLFFEFRKTPIKNPSKPSIKVRVLSGGAKLKTKNAVQKVNKLESIEISSSNIRINKNADQTKLAHENRGFTTVETLDETAQDTIQDTTQDTAQETIQETIENLMKELPIEVVSSLSETVVDSLQESSQVVYESSNEVADFVSESDLLNDSENKSENEFENSNEIATRNTFESTENQSFEDASVAPLETDPAIKTSNASTEGPEKPTPKNQERANPIEKETEKENEAFTEIAAKTDSQDEIANAPKTADEPDQNEKSEQNKPTESEDSERSPAALAEIKVYPEALLQGFNNWWIWISSGANFTSVDQSVSQVNLKFESFEAPSLFFEVGKRWSDRLQTTVAHKYTPGSINNENNGQNLTYEWRSTDISTNYSIFRSPNGKHDWQVAGGVENHDYPLFGLDDSNQVEINTMNLVLAAAGVSYSYNLTPLWKVSYSQKILYPFFKTVDRGDLSMTSPIMIDGAIGTTFRVFNHTWIGASWYGQWHAFDYALTGSENASGTHKILYSNIELRMGIEF